MELRVHTSIQEIDQDEQNHWFDGSYPFYVGSSLKPWKPQTAPQRAPDGTQRTWCFWKMVAKLRWRPRPERPFVWGVRVRLGWADAWRRSGHSYYLNW